MNTLNISLNLNKKEKGFLLSTKKKVYVILQKSVLRCHQIGVVEDLSDLSSSKKVLVKIVDSLKDTNFSSLLEQEVKYLDIDNRYKDEEAVYLLVRFNNEYSDNAQKLKDMLKR